MDQKYESAGREGHAVHRIAINLAGVTGREPSAALFRAERCNSGHVDHLEPSVVVREAE